MKGEGVRDAAIAFRGVGVGEDILAADQVGSELSAVLFAYLTDHVMPECARSAENVARVEFVFILKRRHGAV